MTGLDGGKASGIDVAWPGKESGRDDVAGDAVLVEVDQPAGILGTVALSLTPLLFRPTPSGGACGPTCWDAL